MCVIYARKIFEKAIVYITNRFGNIPEILIEFSAVVWTENEKLKKNKYTQQQKEFCWNVNNRKYHACENTQRGADQVNTEKCSAHAETKRDIVEWSKQ